MPSHRTERVAEAIRETVATSILFEMSDPRVKGVTVIRAEVSGDLRHATVFLTLMGTPTERDVALHAIRHAAGFLQSKVANRLQTRYTPVLSFKEDKSVQGVAEVSRLIDQISTEREAKQTDPDNDFDDEITDVDISDLEDIESLDDDREDGQTGRADADRS